MTFNKVKSFFLRLQDEFELKAQAIAAKGVSQGEKRFKAEPVSPGEWERQVF